MSRDFAPRQHELAFRTQYAELKDRVSGRTSLLPGTPGTLTLREGSGQPHWYRVFYPFPGKQSEAHVCKQGDESRVSAMREEIEFAAWVSRQVSALRKLGFQVADKSVARVLVELHNLGAFQAGLVLVGTLSYMAWLNELGVIAVGARTEDIDLARRRRLELEAPIPFLPALQATGMRFHAVPGLSRKQPPTAAKLRGAQGLRVDVLATGKQLGKVVPIPELSWAGQAVPYYEYLLEQPEPGVMLAGGHCIPVRLSNVARWVWHKLYSSKERRGFREKAAKDRQQALTLVVALSESDPDSLREALGEAPRALVTAVRSQASVLGTELDGHAFAAELLRDCLHQKR